MVDNVAITAGSGTTIAADDIGGVLHQRVKIAQGADGTGVDVSSAAPLQVTLANTGANATAVKVDGSAVTQPVSLTSTTVTGTVAVTESGTWTVQPGNTANTTAWKVDGSAVTQPVSASSLPLPTGASTLAGQATVYTEDAAAAADPLANMMMAVRRDTLSTSEVSADGDNIAMKATSKGQLHVATDARTISGVTVSTGSGAMDTGTQRVAMATDSPGIITTGTAGSASATVLSIQGVASMTAVAVSAASLPLPSGAATLAKQPALGTAGTASADVISVQGVASMTPVQQAGYQVTCSTDITRPADTNAYTANDTWSDSTSAPTAGGYTLTSAARVSGGSGIITDMYIMSSAVPGTLLQGEIHLFDSAATAVNDNAAWALSDADAKLRVGIVAFTLLADANNSYYHAQNLNIGYTCVGTANLRYLVKVKNAYTPISGEVLTVRAKCIQNT